MGRLLFGEAVRMGDAAALAALYTEDARLLPPNSEMIIGKEAIEAFWPTRSGFRLSLTSILS